MLIHVYLTESSRRSDFNNVYVYSTLRPIYATSGTVSTILEPGHQRSIVKMRPEKSARACLEAITIAP